MNLSINGKSQIPPGFRFHPTEEELLHYYLRKKVTYQKIDLDVILEVDLNKLEPWDIEEKCNMGSTQQTDWYFFSHKDKKYPTGIRTNRATAAGFWKATGRDKPICSELRRIGLRKTLVFYKGRAPHGQKSDWIMHEYRLDEAIATNSVSDSMIEDGWVVCRAFRKKDNQKTQDSPRSSSMTQMVDSEKIGVVDQIRLYMGRTACKFENESFNNNIRFMHLSRLENPTFPMINSPFIQDYGQTYEDKLVETDPLWQINNWAAFDQLVASQLNGQEQDESFNELNPSLCVNTC